MNKTLRFNSEPTPLQGEPRRETEDGREYLVVPAAASRQQVLAYDDAPDAYDREFLPDDELAVGVERTNAVPVTLNHPLVASPGGIQSALTTTPGAQYTEVGEFRGLRMNAGNMKVLGEVWLPVDGRDEHTDDYREAFDTLEDDGEVPTSFGYGVGEVDPTPGRHNGEQYSAVQRSLEIDHLALITNGKPRCAPNAGCAIGRANAQQNDDDVPTAAFGEPLSHNRSETTDMSDDSQTLLARARDAYHALGAALGTGRANAADEADIAPSEGMPEVPTAGTEWGDNPIPEDARQNATQYSAGDVVEYTDDGQTGIVLEVLTSDFTWPQGEDDEIDVEASTDSPMCVIARESGGSGVYETSELSSGSFDADEPDMDDLRENATVPEWYNHLDDPFSYDEVHDAVRGNANIPGVDDPEVGFAPGEPEGWTRKSYLQAYASVGGSWRSCVADMTGDVRSPKRWCSALKDTVYGTERWRGRFNAVGDEQEQSGSRAGESGRGADTDDTTQMRNPDNPTDDEMIDFLADETDFDRENAEKLRGEDCLGLTYERFNAEAGTETIETEGGDGGETETETTETTESPEQPGSKDTSGDEPALTFESEEAFNEAVHEAVEERENAQKEQSLIDWIDSRSERFNAESLEGTPQPVLEEIADDVADGRENAAGPYAGPRTDGRTADRSAMQTSGGPRVNAETEDLPPSSDDESYESAKASGGDD